MRNKVAKQIRKRAVGRETTYFKEYEPSSYVDNKTGKVIKYMFGRLELASGSKRKMYKALKRLYKQKGA